MKHIIGTLVLRTPAKIWHFYPGWLRDIGWLHGNSDARTKQ